MPPKKRKRSPNKDGKDPELVEEWLDKELDLVKDLNDDFFQTFNMRIQYLMQNNRIIEATHMKKTSDLLFSLHRKYVAELEENNELKPKIERANVMYKLALELTGSSQDAMENLKKHLEEAWKESDICQLRELFVQQDLQELMVKRENEKKEIGDGDGDEAGLGPLTKYRNVIMRERDRLNAEVSDMEKRLQMVRYYAEGLEDLNRDLEESKNKQNLRLKILSSEKNNMEIKSRSLALALEDQKNFGNKTVNKLNSVTKELQALYNKFHDQSTRFDKQKHKLDKVQTELGSLQRVLKKMEFELAEYLAEKRELEATIRELREEDKMKAGQIFNLNKELKKAERDHNTMSSKLLKMDRLNGLLNEDIVKQKTKVNSLENDLITAARSYADLNRLKESISRERENLRSEVGKMNNMILNLKHTIASHESKIYELQAEISKLNMKLDEAKIAKKKAEQDRDDMAQEKEIISEKASNLQDDLNLKLEHITNLTTTLNEKNASLMDMKKNLDKVHSEKVIVQKNLDGCTQERDNLRNLQARSTHQIAQMTNETYLNQKHINQLNLHIEHLNAAKKDLENFLKNTEKILGGVRKELNDTKVKNHDLMKNIEDDEKRFMKLNQELNTLNKEKNLTGQQMVRRNDEIVFLTDKLHTAQIAVDLGEQQYNQRVEDIRLLKTEIKNLQTERDCLSRAVKSTADMRLEVTRLHRALNQERIRVRALTEDARTPATVHRWRILKGSEPSKYQLIMKCQTLQRRNMKHEIDKTNLNQRLIESEKLCESLKKIIDNLPPSDVKVKLAESQRALRVREKRLKVLAAELSVNEIEVKARDCLIEEYKTTLKAAQDALAEEQQQKDYLV